MYKTTCEKFFFQKERYKIVAFHLYLYLSVCSTYEILVIFIPYILQYTEHNFIYHLYAEVCSRCSKFLYI